MHGGKKRNILINSPDAFLPVAFNPVNRALVHKEFFPKPVASLPKTHASPPIICTLYNTDKMVAVKLKEASEFPVFP